MQGIYLHVYTTHIYANYIQSISWIKLATSVYIKNLQTLQHTQSPTHPLVTFAVNINLGAFKESL